MAEFPMNGPSDMRGSRQSVGVVANYAGAVVSLALIVGIGTWGYKILSRDVSGVPVVRAASDGPMRIVPENPGGADAEHQGLSVNKVMAEGGAGKPADKLVLAPKPVALTEEDQPLDARVAPQAANAPQEDLKLGAVEEDEPLSPQMASIKAFADKLANGAAPLAEVEEAKPVAKPAVKPTVKPTAEQAIEQEVKVAAAAPVATAVPEVAAVEQAQQAATRTLRPRLRPAALKTAVASSAASSAAATVPASAPAADEVDVANVPSGTRLVQLGAFDSPDVARNEWSRLSTRFEDYLDGKQRIVMKAKSGGRVFYRLRAMGFADLSDARRFCAALVAEKADCIPVVSK